MKSQQINIRKERNSYVTLKSSVLELYLDEDRNPCFGGVTLDELDHSEEAEYSQTNISLSRPGPSRTKKRLAGQVAALKQQLEMRNKCKDLGDLTKRFVLKSFGKRSILSYHVRRRMY